MTNKEQFDKLYAQNKTKLYNVAFSVTKNREAAEDILLDSFIKAWNKFDEYDSSKKFANWMTTIVKNTAIDYTRKKTKESSTYSFDQFNYHKLPDNNLSGSLDLEDKKLNLFKQIERQESMQLLLDTIEKLPEDLKLVMIPFFENYSYNQISESTNLTVATVRARVHRAKKILRKSLSYENFANF
jgi:RNA polymerase sigma-70 factor, ECF subfamily